MPILRNRLCSCGTAEFSAALFLRVLIYVKAATRAVRKMCAYVAADYDRTICQEHPTRRHRRGWAARLGFSMPAYPERLDERGHQGTSGHQPDPLARMERGDSGLRLSPGYSGCCLSCGGLESASLASSSASRRINVCRRVSSVSLSRSRL